MGRTLFNFITQSPYLETFLCSSTGVTSTLDLCIVSSSLLSVATSIALGDIGSDHYPVKLTLKVKSPLILTAAKPKWKIPTKYRPIWKKWKDCLESEAEILEDSSCENTNLSSFIDTLNSPASQVFKKQSGVYNQKYSKSWWNEECSKIVAMRRLAKRKFSRHNTVQNMLA
ncbi:unnamed protein product [Rotaria magnacalcarata]|uniref:Endonuclease/exonuclease/phosphatase domain-containing protein n=1 Tax=Rotaria magnacalcarata TaxID=392030 RepID=A0A819S319_9BILA|nr:unnamed protein product [Rotaria magnacalcarata]CAF4056592.1 unnamed protein product [Rotaria magnacalcarata]